MEEKKFRLDGVLQDKDNELQQMRKQLSNAQLTSTTVKQWLDEDKNRFFQELNVLAENNVVLKTSCNVLQERLRVLHSVEQQLKESLTEDVEVDGIFISHKFFDTMMADIVTKGQNMWEMIQQRLVTVIQRPYQMFQLRDKTEEEQNLHLELVNVKAEFNKLQLQMSLAIKENELLQERSKKMLDKQIHVPMAVHKNTGSDRESDFDRLLSVLQKVIDRKGQLAESEVEKESDEEWKEIFTLLGTYRQIQPLGRNKMKLQMPK